LALLHESISREHAALIFDEQLGALLIDLGSTAGTKIDGNVIQDNVGVPLKDGSEVIFGASSRVYKTKVDYTKFRKALEEKQR